MMYTVSTEECEKLGIPFSTFLYLLSVYSDNLITESCHNDANNRRLFTFSSRDYYGNPVNPSLTEYGKEVIEEILEKSKKRVPSDEEISIIAESLRNIWPAGKKPGTPYPWKDSQKGIELRLKRFFVLYGDNYTGEQIINAAREYVEAFKGDYKFMRLLKYFIWKKEDGEESSELASYIDNAGQEDETSGSDWINELV